MPARVRRGGTSRPYHEVTQPLPGAVVKRPPYWPESSRAVLAPMLLSTRTQQPEGKLKSLLFLLTSAAVGAAACGSSATTSTGPSPAKCQVTLSAPQGALDPNGGSAAVTVATQAECAWNATSDVGWISGFSPASGQGPGEVRFQVAANPAPALRQGRITLNGVAVQVSQNGLPCTVELSPQSQAIGASGGSGAVDVLAPAGCTWHAQNSEPWLTITSGANGSGNGTVGFVASANAGAARIGGIAVADRILVVTQAAVSAPQCTYAIPTPSVNVSATAGTTTASVQAASGCSWTAASNASWLAVTGASVGSGNGSVTITVSANTGAARNGTVTIAGQSFTVNQAGVSVPVPCGAVSFNPSSATLPAAGGAGPSIAVNAGAGCPWTASTATSWLTITQGASGSGNGVVLFSATANTGNVRTGSLTIGGQTFAVTQPGSCATSINPSSQSLPATSGTGTAIAVSAAGGCNWTATTGASWITITGGASGSGNGNVTFTFTANTGSSRVGTISIGTQAHTVTQAGTCATTIAPASQSASAAGGDATSITVTSPAGCNWTATPSQSWLTITSGASGSGNGAVAFKVGPNTGPARSATITIAGQTHTVNQANGCTYSLTPTSHSLDSDAQTAPAITVNTAAGCTWTAQSNTGFITVQSGASGTGTGTVTYRVTKHNGKDPRTGTLTIAGRTFTVVQDNN